MNYVFICPGMPFNGETIQAGKSLGGSESACYYVARGIAKLGNRVLVMTNDQEAQGCHDGVDYAWAGPQSERTPIGEYAHRFMESTPNDVLVVQRAPGIHKAPPQAKVAFWWLHDLALLRMGGAVRADLFNYDGILAVSDWHRRQISETYDIGAESIWVLPNSVDKELYVSPAIERPPPQKGELRMLYQSRPERGIDYLIAPGGIMDQLHRARPGAHLYVCGYENYPEQMARYYQSVHERIESMPNVTWLGHLSKADLAKQQQKCDLMIYPGEFEETSCISAMEAQAAGLPLLASATGALPETCKGGGAHLVRLRDGHCNVPEFVQFAATANKSQLENMRRQQLRKAQEWDWDTSARVLANLVNDRLEAKRKNVFSTLRTMLDRSDVLLARQYVRSPKQALDCDVTPEIRELNDAYQFAHNPHEHYDADHAVADIERGGDSLDVRGNLRFSESVNWLLQEKPKRVLDYGCQKGHYIWSMAQHVKSPEYVGVDISPRVIEWAVQNCVVEGTNIQFYAGDIMREDFPFDELGKFDAIMLGEILEHVEEPVLLMSRLSRLMQPGCRVVVTTPFGEWEGKDYYANPTAQRYHLHHFEHDDLREMFSHHRGYLTTCVPAGASSHGVLGSWVSTFLYDEGLVAKSIDFDRKLRNYAARQTVSYCAIVRNAESTILRSLFTVNEIADEFVIALDRTTSDGTRAILERFRDQHAGFRRFDIVDADSPIDIGFDEARNRTIDRARGDWILWLDADEDLVNVGNLHKYLRANPYDGYGVAQHHVSTSPVGVLTVDWPVRLFRHVDYLRFCGVVHEHPDDIETPNRGPRHPAQLLDFHIVHHGYTTEPVRRQRFTRNLPLIKRDRVQNPDRVLGRLLWLRDLSHQVMFALESSGGRPTPEALDFAAQGLKEWEDLLALPRSPIVDRMIRDGLEFYSNLVRVTGRGFEADLRMNIVRGQLADANRGQRRAGCFLNREHFDKYMTLCVDEQTRGFDSKYF